MPSAPTSRRPETGSVRPEEAAADAAEPSWDELLAEAVAGTGVVPVFQPVVDLARNVVAGYEALARFTQLPTVTPDRWFAEARDRGLAEALDAATLRAALAHRRTIPANCFLSLNVEPESLAHGAVRRVLDDAGSLGGIVLELTEHCPIDDYKATEGLLRPYRRAGALVAVDDAGAGYCGLQQILRLRPEIVKVDRGLVSDIDRDEAKASLLEMLGAFASRIDAWLLAEGVERPEEAERLRRLEVPLAQGYHFARPAPPWASIDPSPLLAADDPRAEATRTLSLRPLLEVLPWVRDDRATSDDRWDDLGVDAAEVVVLDVHGRPVGVVRRTSYGLRSRVLTGPCVNVDAHPVDLAHRLSTGSDPAIPNSIPVVDAAGRYVGIVRITALLADLARRAAR